MGQGGEEAGTEQRLRTAPGEGRREAAVLEQLLGGQCWLKSILGIVGPVLPVWAKDFLQHGPLQAAPSVHIPGPSPVGWSSGAGPRGSCSFAQAPQTGL